MSALTPVRLLVVDDHAVVRQGFVRLLNLQPGLEVVGECSAGEETEAAVSRLSPDVVIMDIMLKKMTGIEATRRIKAVSPKTEVIILSMLDKEEYIFESIMAGASGYLVKDATIDELVRAIRLIHAGEALMYPSVTRKVLTKFVNLVNSDQGQGGWESAAGQADLSARHKQILELVSQGKSNKEIASLLGTSEVTVKAHLRNIYAKLEVADRAAAVAAALRRGIIQ